MSKKKPTGPSFQARFYPALLRQLRKTGIHLEPFFTVREGESGDAPASADRKFRFGFISEEETDALMKFKDSRDQELYQLWLKEGKRCFGAWDGPRLAAIV